MRFRLVEAESNLERATKKNNAQTEVGSKLVTHTDSPIVRNKKYGVGKKVMDTTYAHIRYLKDVLGEEQAKFVTDILQSKEFKDYTNGIKFNCFNYNPKLNTLAVQEGPDFDTADEPVVGVQVKIDLNDGSYQITKGSPFQQIWHHKWLWVKNDYDGFNVEDSWNRSREWLNQLPTVANGVNKAQWDKQLADNNVRFTLK